MSPVLFFYLADVLNGLGVPLFICGLLVCPAFCFIYFGAKCVGESDEKNLSNIILSGIRVCIIWTTILWTIAALLPKKETMYLMAASSVVMDVAKNDRVRSIADNSLTLIEEKIKEYTEKKKETK